MITFYLAVIVNPVFKHPVALLYLKLFMYYTVRQQFVALLTDCVVHKQFQ
jgi:hypothetical protein